MTCRHSFILLFTVSTIACLTAPPQSSAQPQQLSGPQSGVLEAGLYDVVGNIYVPYDEEWYLEAGVRLRFYPGTTCTVDWALFAGGEPGDSVYFEPYDPDLGWEGIGEFVEIPGS